MFIKEVREVFGTDRQTDGHFRSTSGRTDGRFDGTSGPLPVHLVTIGGHMRHHSYSLPKKLMFAKFAHERTDERTNERKKKQTSKVPFRINARELKISAVVLFCCDKQQTN